MASFVGQPYEPLKLQKLLLRPLSHCPGEELHLTSRFFFFCFAFAFFWASEATKTADFFAKFFF